MYGAIIGDIVGSKYEFHNIKRMDFPFISDRCCFTDDTAMTVAVANALLISGAEGRSFRQTVVEQMRRIGREYPHAGYGGRFSGWLVSAAPKPYYSFGNGSAMRVSPCGLIAVTLDEALSLAEASADVTHNHPEGIKGAKAAAAAVFLAKSGCDKSEIREYITRNYYNLAFTLDEIRPTYKFDETCQGSVPQALEAFFEAESYEETIRAAVSIGGDSDTIAAIAGGVAWSHYMSRGDGANDLYKSMVEKYEINKMLPDEFVSIIGKFDEFRAARESEFKKTGCCPAIPL